MIVYHGTVKAYLSDILRDGLKPKPENAWRIRVSDEVPLIGGEELRDIEPVEYVYVDKDFQISREFAENKADYLRAKPGYKLKDFYGTKDKNAPMLRTSPIVLVLDLPDSYTLKVDPCSYTEGGLRYKGNIPPSLIKKVIPVRANGHKTA
jgi:hypothetical protein